MMKVTQRLLGPVTALLLALTFWLGLWVTPPDETQGDLVRLLLLGLLSALTPSFSSFS